MVNKLKRQLDVERIQKVNALGLNIHKGIDNGNYRSGNRIVGNHPCPKCHKERICEKRDAFRICKICFQSRGRKFNWNDWRQKVQIQSKEFALKYKGGKCNKCGVGNLPACCYHFHHKDPNTKEFSLGTKFNQKITDKIIKELDKCIVLCANCHAKEHWDNRASISYS